MRRPHGFQRTTDLARPRRTSAGRLGKQVRADNAAIRALTQRRVLIREVTAATVAGSVWDDTQDHSARFDLGVGWTCSCRNVGPCLGIATLQRLTAPLALPKEAGA